MGGPRGQRESIAEVKVGLDDMAWEVTPHPSRDGWRERRRGTPSPQGEGCIFDFGIRGVQPKIWGTISPRRGEGVKEGTM